MSAIDNSNKREASQSPNKDHDDEEHPSKRHKKEHVVWDELNLAEVEAGKSSTMKIDEPNTPFHYYAVDEDEEVLDALRRDRVAERANSKVLEVASFRLNAGVSQEDFLSAATATQGLLAAQPGFLTRALAVNNEDGGWEDHLFWRSLDDAKAAMEPVMSSPAFEGFSAAMDPESVVVRHISLMWAATSSGSGGGKSGVEEEEEEKAAAAVELVTFTVVGGTSDSELIEAVRGTEAAVAGQAGYLSRSLLCDEHGVWTDRIVWASLAHGTAATAALKGHAALAPLGAVSHVSRRAWLTLVWESAAEGLKVVQGEWEDLSNDDDGNEGDSGKHKETHEEFLEHRAKHYREGEMLKKWKAEHANEDEE